MTDQMEQLQAMHRCHACLRSDKKKLRHAGGQNYNTIVYTCVHSLIVSEQIWRSAILMTTQRRPFGGRTQVVAASMHRTGLLKPRRSRPVLFQPATEPKTPSLVVGRMGLASHATTPKQSRHQYAAPVVQHSHHSRRYKSAWQNPHGPLLHDGSMTAAASAAFSHRQHPRRTKVQPHR